jgi:hypothetical protein
VKNIADEFPISDDEYGELDKTFGDLCRFAAWQLLKKNANNNHTDDFEDVNQELLMSLVRAGSYYKRQVYIENCFRAAREYARDGFVNEMLMELERLWANRTRHGANRQKYGPYQERLLERIVQMTVPQDFRPDKAAPLKIDAKFTTYCKTITWNAQKSMGRRITREKVIRSGQVSLSEFDYLSCVETSS